jgi:hypothetical protein
MNLASSVFTIPAWSEAFDNGKACTPTVQMGGRVTYIHHAVMQPLVPGRRYCYRVGSEHVFSEAFEFVAVDTSPRPITFAVTGDMGVNRAARPFVSNASMDAVKVGIEETLPQLVQGDSEFLVHYGDLAYDLGDSGRPGEPGGHAPPGGTIPEAVCGNGTTGDHFMRIMETYAARRPYMVIPGNHERQFNFTHLHHRFDMPLKTKVGAPSSADNHWYSLDVSYAHLVFIDTELWFSNRGPLHNPNAVFIDDADGAETGGFRLRRQWDWLVADLDRANQNRAQRPWVLVFGAVLQCIRNILKHSC